MSLFPKKFCIILQKKQQLENGTVVSLVYSQPDFFLNEESMKIVMQKL